MIDVSAEVLERAIASIAGNLDRQVKKGTIDAAGKDAALGASRTRRRWTRCATPSLVVEAATERADLKFRIFEDIDRHAPAGAILATNTSSISITQIAARTKRPEAVVGMHFMNPVPVMQLVEIIRGQATSDDTTGAGRRSREAARQDAGRGERLPGIHRQPHPDADDQRGGLSA